MKPIRRRPSSTTVVFVLVLVGACVGCNGIFYFPSSDLVRTPDEVGVSYRPVSIVADGEPTLQGWYLPAATTHRRGTVLFLHGNAENISTHLASVYWLPAEGYAVYIIDYRGYGESEGVPDVEGLHRDVQRMIRYVLGQTDPTGGNSSDDIFLFGQSLGASMALYTVSTAEFAETFRAVIVDSPFAAYRGIAREKLSLLWITWPLQWPLGFLIRDDFSPIHHIEQVRAPVLFIHGDSDLTVLPAHSLELCERIPDRCTRIMVSGSGHNESLNQLNVRRSVLEFLHSHLSTR